VKKQSILRVKPFGRAALRLGGLMVGTLLAISLVPGSAADVLASQSSSESEAPAFAGTGTIVTAEFTYASIYKTGYSRSLADLGETPAGTPTSASRADLMDNYLAGGKKNGLIFIYKPGRKDKAGKTSDYTLTVRPSKWQVGSTSFFTDQTGVIHATTENRAATVKDPEEGKISLPNK
jgi:hypothetical protein